MANSILITSESRYPIHRKRIRETIKVYLEEKNLTDVEVSVAVVGSRKIRELNAKWRALDETTTVLTFGLEEGRREDGLLPLGDIVISYPQAREIAQDENYLMDQAIDRLVIHGMNNLLTDWTAENKQHFENDQHSLSQTPP